MTRIAFALLLSAVLAATRAAAAPAVEVKEWSLPNGLSVVFVPVHRAPVVSVQVWYEVGSRDEPKGYRGSAHMFEHLMFKGSERVRPEDHARLVDRIGGEANAFTEQDMTAYHQTLPARALDLALELEADRMRRLVFQEEIVRREREVVKEEKRLKIDDSPLGRAYARFRELVFGGAGDAGHPYQWLGFGEMADLDRLDAAWLKRFYDSWYQPAGATLVVVGDTTEGEVRRLVEKHFGGIPRGAIGQHPAAAEAAAQTEARRETVGPAQIPVVLVGWKTPAASAPDRHALEVLVRILGGGDSARLHQRVAIKDKLAVGAFARLDQMKDAGVLMVAGVARSSQALEPFEKALVDEVARLARQAPTAKELAKARNQLAAEHLFSLQTVQGLAGQIGRSKLLRGSATAWLADAERYRAVTAADVQRVARTWLGVEKATIVVVPPAVAAGGGAP